mgnify:CR=1 FL=1
MGEGGSHPPRWACSPCLDTSVHDAAAVQHLLAAAIVVRDAAARRRRPVAAALWRRCRRSAPRPAQPSPPAACHRSRRTGCSSGRGPPRKRTSLAFAPAQTNKRTTLCIAPSCPPAPLTTLPRGPVLPLQPRLLPSAPKPLPLPSQAVLRSCSPSLLATSTMGPDSSSPPLAQPSPRPSRFPPPPPTPLSTAALVPKPLVFKHH